MGFNSTFKGLNWPLQNLLPMLVRFMVCCYGTLSAGCKAFVKIRKTTNSAFYCKKIISLHVACFAERLWGCTVAESGSIFPVCLIQPKTLYLQKVMYWRPFLHFACKGTENRQQNSESRHVTTNVRHQPPHGTKLLGGSVGATLGPDTSEKRKNPSRSSLSPQASHPYYTQISFSRREKKQAIHPSIHF